jgi:putative membrane protein
MFQKLPKISKKQAIVTLFLFHFSGIIAILYSPFQDLFLSLTPLNLLVSFILLMYFHGSFSKAQLFVFASITILGFGVEAVGVATGKIFGIYEYGTVLGWKMFETPLMIGINWILLTYSFVFSWARIIENKIVLAFVSAISMVVLDFIIEPVAILYNLWNWENSEIPIQNYAAWGIIAFIFSLALTFVKKSNKNDFAPYLIGAQIIFFSALLFLS